MGFALFSSNVAYPQLLELPVDTGVGLGLSLLGASLVIMPSGVVMMILSPLSGRLARAVGPRILLAAGAVALIIAYGFSFVFASEVWHIFVANVLIGFGIGFGYAAMPMLIMRSVPPSETGASNGLNALARSLGTSTAAAVVGAVLAGMSVTAGDAQIPTAAAFDTTYVLGAVAAVGALVLALCIPRRASGERHPSLPQ
jgi:MFS family permease